MIILKIKEIIKIKNAISLLKDNKSKKNKKKQNIIDGVFTDGALKEDGSI